MATNNHRDRAHPALDLLLARAVGLLDAAAAARVDAHVSACTACRLELARAARFQELDGDNEAAAEADWAAAAPRLDEAWRHTIAPALVPRRRRVPRWLVPAAAAAVLALVAVNVGEQSLRPGVQPGVDTVRGLPAAVPVIRPLEPTGDCPGSPACFAWVSDREFDAFALEVFTAELGTVLRLDDLQQRHADLSDSVRARLEPGITYFWHVEGWEGLTAVEASPTVSFRIAPAGD